MTTTQTDHRPPIADFRWLTGRHDTRMFGTARITRRDIIAALGGIVVGAAGAAFYYDQTMRPLAHTLQMWVLLDAVVATRQPPLRGTLQGAMAEPPRHVRGLQTLGRLESCQGTPPGGTRLS